MKLDSETGQNGIGCDGQSRRRRGGEEGYILVAVLFLVVLVLIALSVAAPKVAADIERDREIELMHRGKQYERAIKLYYKKFGAYPPSMDALEKTQEIRFLRKRYKDPVTGKDEWHLIHFGENKTPTAMGFFGQPLGGVGGATLAGVGPGGVGQNIGSPIGGSTTGGSSINGIGGGSSGAFGGSMFGNSGATGTDPNAGANGAAGSTSTAGVAGATGTAGSPTDPNAAGGSSTGSSIFGSSSTTGGGQTFGGGGVIGVESTSPKLAILEYKKKKHFNEWEFVYDPQAERLNIGGNAGAIGQPMSGAGNSIGNGTGGIGGNSASPSQFNQNPLGPGTTPTSPTTPTAPTPTTPQ